jgi:Dip2/Utp12 Family
LAVVLFQSLHNNDNELLEFCFSNEDEDLIENTVKRLQETKILVLIDRIVERIDSQKGQSNILVWLKYLLKHHSTFLIKRPKSAEKLAPLIPMLEKRTASFDKIHRVKGMIDMLLDVGESVAKDTKKQKKLTINNKPLVVFEEGNLSRL